MPEVRALNKAAGEPATLLSVSGIDVGYGRVGVLQDVSLAVVEGQICAIVGSNGAGKSTLLKAISGLLAPTKGEISYQGESIGGLSPARIVQKGLLHVAEGRRLFRHQSVRSNLDLGLYGAGLTREDERGRLTEVLGMFPVLSEKLDLAAGGLSGGQQQMLAIGQALMRSPRLLMLDEPSLGLAPVVVDQVLETLQKLRSQGCTVILVEQLVERALEICDACVVMQHGRVIGRGTADEVTASGLIEHAYGAV
ncbi:LIV-I protein F [Variovorax sp. SRS16]|uniref:ABC transporter ATP-binding protein n=1 Tax=Variovorax sp. SRS16 TaxID=282217 RepID=UPI0013194A95|nr:ABC transporter ATP-binding protein [Variovorax sp. SRS16]VTU33724.1 LIV-I protein F [Variovorax sp. SRS16]